MTSRNSLILISAITAALAAPLAFAQDDNASATAQVNAVAQAATSATPATPPSADTAAMAATPATPATPAQPSTSAKKVTWSQLDGDHDGKLTRTEAAAIDSLTEVFDQADADKDGALTADEYKAWLAARGNGSTGNNG
ncbi:MAG: EF-hand domain-containing protein [Luteimonas sp.]